MVVGVGEIQVFIHESNSLKAKRSVMKSITAKTRTKFNIAIAETEDHDKWQKGTLGFAVVTNDSAHAHTMLESIHDFIENLHAAEVISFHVEIIHFSQEHAEDQLHR